MDTVLSRRQHGIVGAKNLASWKTGTEKGFEQNLWLFKNLLFCTFYYYYYLNSVIYLFAHSSSCEFLILSEQLIMYLKEAYKIKRSREEENNICLDSKIS